MKDHVKKFDFSKLDFDVLRERERQEAARRRAEMERIRREEEEAAIAPPPVIFSEEEYNNAVNEAAEKGKAEGLRQATTEQNQEILNLLKNLLPKMQELCNSEDERNRLFEEYAVKTAVLIAKKAVPALFEKEAANEITAFIAEAVKSAGNAPMLRVIVPPELKDVIRERLNIMFDDKSFEKKIEVIGEEGVHAGSCRIEWSDITGIEMNPEKILEKIGKITECYSINTGAGN